MARPENSSIIFHPKDSFFQSIAKIVRLLNKEVNLKNLRKVLDHSAGISTVVGRPLNLKIDWRSQNYGLSIDTLSQLEA